MEVGETDSASWSTESFSRLELGTAQVKPRIAKLARLARTVATKKPDDENAQHRAQAATAMVAQVAESLHSISRVLPSDDDEDFCDVHSRESGKRHVSSLVSVKRGVRGQTPRRKPSRETRIWLPAEMYQLIVGHVNEFDNRYRQHTLAALSSSCKLLMTMAERFLYAHPRGIRNVQQQWMFLYSLKIQPTRANYVKSLELVCPSDATNMELLKDIASSCPNVNDVLVERGDSVHGAYYLSQSYIISMGSLLAACPSLRSLRYRARACEVYPKPKAFDDDDLDGQGNLSAPVVYSDFQETGHNLTRLAIGDFSGWFIQLMLPVLSSNLTSLTIGRQNNPAGERPLSSLAVRCPCLQELVLDYTLVESTDLKQACKMWGSKLQMLKLTNMEEDSDWLAEIMPSMTALRFLDTGIASACRILDIDAITQSKAPLKEIALGYIKCDRDDIASDEMNAALANMITAHSSRLQLLDLGMAKLGSEILKSCKMARDLRSLQFRLAYRPLPDDIDDLLVACPDLDALAGRVSQYSPNHEIWEARMQTKVLPKLEIVARDSLVVGFGSL
ncbi:hypothetical protein HYE68_011029 [Fusarium pseudograminearum]|nr:hypothetical protein HYE68_011029 [Fusarium pseudograminearum]